DAAPGSRRLRAGVACGGAHPWADRGVANPAHAVGRAIAAIAELAADSPADVAIGGGRIGGGTSVNAVPEDAWFELDLRATTDADLTRIEEAARRAVRAAVDAERDATRAPARPLRATITVIGDRPTGETPAGDPLVRAAAAATVY